MLVRVQEMSCTRGLCMNDICKLSACQCGCHCVYAHVHACTNCCARKPYELTRVSGVCLSDRLSVWPSVCLTVCLSDRLSVCLRRLPCQAALLELQAKHREAEAERMNARGSSVCRSCEPFECPFMLVQRCEPFEYLFKHFFVYLELHRVQSRKAVAKCANAAAAMCCEIMCASYIETICMICVFFAYAFDMLAYIALFILHHVCLWYACIFRMCLICFLILHCLYCIAYVFDIFAYIALLISHHVCLWCACIFRSVFTGL
jgi:hypothetical protein